VERIARSTKSEGSVKSSDHRASRVDAEDHLNMRGGSYLRSTTEGMDGLVRLPALPVMPNGRRGTAPRSRGVVGRDRRRRCRVPSPMTGPARPRRGSLGRASAAPRAWVRAAGVWARPSRRLGKASPIGCLGNLAADLVNAKGPSWSMEPVVERQAVKTQCDQRYQGGPPCHLCRSGHGCMGVGLS
jgi:hypothetical protein